jgi:IclR family acetate operon transcriptional repressor
MPSRQSRQSGRTAGVQSIDRAAAILRSFSEHRAELTLSEIARTTGLTTSTVHRLLGAMHENQLVRGGAVATTLRDAALPTMSALRDEIEETVGLHSLLPTDERVVVDQAESHQPLRRTYTELGLPIPLPYGAPGKVLSAWLLPARCDAILQREIPPLTSTTVTEPTVLRSQFAEIRQRGFAMSLAERTPGIRSVAAACGDRLPQCVGTGDADAHRADGVDRAPCTPGGLGGLRGPRRHGGRDPIQELRARCGPGDTLGPRRLVAGPAMGEVRHGRRPPADATRLV